MNTTVITDITKYSLCNLITNEGKPIYTAQFCHLAGKSETVYPFSVKKNQLLAAYGCPSTWVAL